MNPFFIIIGKFEIMWIGKFEIMWIGKLLDIVLKTIYNIKVYCLYVNI